MLSEPSGVTLPQVMALIQVTDAPRTPVPRVCPDFDESARRTVNNAQIRAYEKIES
jgi:hypothetical protein